MALAGPGGATADLSPGSERAPVIVDEPGLPELSGTWRLDLILATEVQAPLLGKTLLLNHQATLARIEHQGEGYVVHQEACGIRTESERSLVETEFPEAFVRGLPRKSYPLVVYRDGLGWRVEADLPPQHLGYDPTRSEAGRPPRSLDAPGVADTDGDGSPGVTVMARAPLFGEVELFLSQTTTTSLRGRLQPEGVVSGQASLVDMEQWVIGASNRLFHRNPPVRPVAEGSSFTMRQVKAGTSCAELARP